MNSLSKLPVSQEAAQVLFKCHMGSATRISSYQELTEGFFNAAYRVELADGMVCVLKVAPPPEVRVLRYEREILHTEVEVLRLVASRTTMPVPAVLFHDERCDLLPSPCFAMQFMEGEPLHKLRPSLSLEENERIDRVCGDYLRQMNALSGPGFGLYTPSAMRFSTWRQAYEQLLSDVLLDGEAEEIELPLSSEALLVLVRQHYAALDEVTHPALVHWDLWDGNIFINPATRQVNAIIDFERALWADPLMEVNFGAFGFNPAFLQGYGFILPLSPAQQTRRALYNLYLFLIMVIECRYRRYPTNDQENWARGKLANVIAGLQ
jgi:aminoglycoside phosphotransferase (APT) family kinase protein